MSTMGTLDVVQQLGRKLGPRWRELVDSWKGTVFTHPVPGCPIAWKPSVFAPVFYGYQDTIAVLRPEVHSGGAAEVVSSASARIGPGETAVFGHPVRIWFPSLTDPLSTPRFSRAVDATPW